MTRRTISFIDSAGQSVLPIRPATSDLEARTGLRMIAVHTSRKRLFSKATGVPGGLNFTASMSRICEL